MKHIKNLFLIVPLFIFVSCESTKKVQEEKEEDRKIVSKTTGTPEKESSHGFVIDSSENIYLCGTSEGNLTVESNTTYENFFIQKLSPKGENIWIKQYSQIDGNIQTEVAGITIDADDNLYVGGVFVEHSGNTDSGLFITKYNSSGSQIWFHKITNNNAALDVIKTSNDNKLYFSGHKTTTQIDINTGKVTSQTSMFIDQYSLSGEKLLEKEFANIDRNGGYHEVKDIAFDTDNNIYIAGRYISKPFDYPNGDSDLFITKFSLNLEQVWIRTIGAADEIDTDISSTEEIDSMKILDGYIYAIGTTHGDFDNRHGTKTMSLYSHYGIFMKFNTDGAELFRKQFSFNNKNTIPLKLLVDNSSTFTAMVLNGEMNFYSSNTNIINNIALDKVSLSDSGEILNQEELISDNNDIYYLHSLDAKYKADGNLITTSEKNKGGHFVISSPPTDDRDIDVLLTIY